MVPRIKNPIEKRVSKKENMGFLMDKLLHLLKGLMGLVPNFQF
jgi:hypothetical protein